MEYWEAKQIESRNFKEVFKLHPHLFRIGNFIDSPDFLEKYGIFIKDKKKFPLGYLKLWPQDFIVEEIAANGELQTVSPEKFLHTKRDFLPEDPIIYTTLVKCGLSTIEAAEDLARALNLEPKSIKFAGIKDKHAITSQLISMKRGEIAETASHLLKRSEGREMNEVQRTSPRSASPRSVLNQISLPNFFLKNVFSGENGLYPGNLKGNQFTILIRTGPNFNNFKKEEFLKRLKEVEKNGFFNFFYLQRFGVPRLISPYCGLYIVKGDYEKAVLTEICRPGERESPYFQRIRKEMEKLWGQWQEMESILEFFPITFRVERELLNYLIKNPSDFVGALNQVPQQVSLWVDSFASLLFNKLLSSYIREKKNLPKTLPLVLSPDKRDWLVYEELLKQVEIFSVTFALKNLNYFPFIAKRGKQQQTIETIRILNYKIIPEGIIISFILSKGCYATTFLSHLFNLVSGSLPTKFSNLPIDTKANLNQPSLEEILNKFSDVVSTPAWRFLWRIY